MFGLDDRRALGARLEEQRLAIPQVGLAVHRPHAGADQRLAGEHEDAVRARVWVVRGATVREKRGAAPVEVKRNETQTLDPDVRAGRETGLRHGSRSALGIYRNEPSAVFVRCNELTPEVAE